MTRFHFTQHGTRRAGDALDLLGEEVMLLDHLFSAWAHTIPGNAEQANAVEAKWDHGTVGKLLLEHSAVRVAAERDIVRVLRDRGESELTHQLDDEIHSISPMIVRMYDSGRGIQPISLAITPEFVEAVGELRQALQSGIMQTHPTDTLSRLSYALGRRRSELHSAVYIRRHAPSRPELKWWVEQHPMLIRIQTALDRLSGFPWAESSLGDRKLAARFDREAAE